MPDHVFHDLTITGPKEERERFIEGCFTESDEGPQFDFNKMIPAPDFFKDEPRRLWPAQRASARSRFWRIAFGTPPRGLAQVKKERRPEADADAIYGD
jgi:hypothetical protein